MLTGFHRYKQFHNLQDVRKSRKIEVEKTMEQVFSSELFCPSVRPFLEHL